MAFSKPPNYTPPSSGGNYYRPPNGDSRIRIVSPSFTQGNEAWEELEDGKKRPVRRPLGEIISGNVKDHKEYMAFAILDRSDLKVKVWVVTQRGIQKALDGLMDDPDWGDLNTFDLKIRRQGEGLNTEYSVTPCPKAPLVAEALRIVDENPVNLKALFTNDDPFAYDANPDGTIANSETDGNHKEDGTIREVDAVSDDPF